jgi:hypothetical protein
MHLQHTPRAEKGRHFAGVIVAPFEQIDEIAKIAWDIAKGDKAGRKKLY